MENDIETLEMLVRYFEEYINNTYSSRKLAERDRDYYDNKQWTEAEESTLNKRGQAAIVNNRIKPKIDAQLGIERKTRSDPKAQPRTKEHEQDSQSVTDALRYVADNNEFDQTVSQVNENLLIEGVGGCTVDVVAKGNDFEIETNPILWDRLFYDVHSRKRDFADTKYRGISIWMDLDDAIDLFPSKKALLANAVIGNEIDGDTFSDRPRFKWSDTDRRRIRINLAYYQKKRKWHFAFYTKEGLLSTPKHSPYLDEDGMPECPIILQSAFIDRYGMRYGSVRQLIGIQSEINKRHSKALHLLSVRQTFGEEGAVEDIPTMKRELSKPDGHVETRAGSEFGKTFGILPTGDMAAAQFELLREAKNDIDQVGMNPELSGNSQATSGRDFIARQEAGFNEQGVVFDSLRSWKIRVYRQIWNRIRQYWTEEKWIRVTDDPENIKWVALNQPVTVGDKLTEEFGELPQEYDGDPRLGVQVGVKNEVAKIDVDIILDESPDIISIQQEQFELVAKLYQANPKEVPFDAVISLSSLRNKKQFLEKIKGNEEQQAAQAQKLDEASQIQKEQIISDIENTKADTEKKQADTVKTMVEVQAIN